LYLVIAFSLWFIVPLHLFHVRFPKSRNCSLFIHPLSPSFPPPLYPALLFECSRFSLSLSIRLTSNHSLVCSLKALSQHAFPKDFSSPSSRQSRSDPLVAHPIRAGPKERSLSPSRGTSFLCCCRSLLGSDEFLLFTSSQLTFPSRIPPLILNERMVFLLPSIHVLVSPPYKLLPESPLQFCFTPSFQPLFC